ncbi:glutamyl-tRNA reductase [Telmatospirillum siberiense]|uniref:Glutamyl-tRNA reductase n=1 Tax=Telmatospirillum siberiense TaxID=382514 RepID=A0A2N3Q0Y9_9PROT|nr:glutamyl-tRNA reductase [Telmatospirillum siberiense]PKU26326.1 glutamyl-tRNA reductase [Telmatospirillum siberiense]
MNDNRFILRPIIVGANHRSSSLALRDALFVDDAAQPFFLAALRQAGLAQAVVLSTCDRVEVLTMHHDAAVAEAIIAQAFAMRGHVTTDGLAGQLYTLADEAAVKHCFAVTASLDSLIIGEPYVLGQVKACHRISREAGLCGPEMETLLAAAYAVAKRVRSETAVAERPVSIASAAVQFARDLHGELSDCQALLLGAGEMGGLVAESMLAAGVHRLVVAAPRQSQAESLAESLNCHLGAFENLSELMPDADIVLTAVSGRHHLIGAEHIQAALRKRRRKPVFLVDVGIPGDIDPAVNRVDGAFLYDLTDLERLAMEGRATREVAAREAWTIVDAELTSFSRGRAARVAVPSIVALRSRFEAVRDQALAEAGGDAEKATHLLVSRLLHEPSEAMREIAAGGDGTKAEWDAAEQLLRRLFRLE